MERTKKKIDMDYEKKYKEALKDMRVIYPNLRGDAKLAAEHAFPELAENEDERIRKGLIELIENWDYPQELFTTKRNIVAYLEKQKEQGHPCDSAQFEEGFKTGLELGLRKKKEQEPANGVDYDISLTTNDEPSKLKAVGNVYDNIHNAMEQKPAEWSEEDEKQIRQIERIVKNAGCTSKLQEKIHN